MKFPFYINARDEGTKLLSSDHSFKAQIVMMAGYKQGQLQASKPLIKVANSYTNTLPSSVKACTYTVRT